MFGSQCAAGYIDLLEHVLLVGSLQQVHKDALNYAALATCTRAPAGPAEAQRRLQAAAGSLLQTGGGRRDRAHPDGRSHER